MKSGLLGDGISDAADAEEGRAREKDDASLLDGATGSPYDGLPRVGLLCPRDRVDGIAAERACSW